MATFVKTKQNFFLLCFSRYVMFQVEKMCEQEVKKLRTSNVLPLNRTQKLHRPHISTRLLICVVLGPATTSALGHGHF